MYVMYVYGCVNFGQITKEREEREKTHILNKNTSQHAFSSLFQQEGRRGSFCLQLLSHKRRQRQRQRQPQAKTNRKHIGTTLPDV